MSKDYSSKDIQVLDGLKHVQLNPNMYISTTDNPCHLIEEALDNALDEAIAGHVNIIAVIADTKTGICSVMDNGRGIPIDKDVAITISTELFSGAKFSDRKTAYDVSCLIGNTKILVLNDDKDINIKEMSDNPNEDYYGLSYISNGYCKVVKLLNPHISGYTKNLIRVHIDNGYYEECTLEHLWMMENGEYKQAKDLCINDSLMPTFSIIKKDVILLTLQEFAYHKTNKYKIKLIEYINLDKEIPVYDLYVPGYKNFMLNSGVVVHNSGLHGVGLVAVYALSEQYKIEIFKDKKHVVYEKKKKLFKKVLHEDFEEQLPYSTKIEFKADKKYFTNIIPDLDRIRKRMTVASVELPKVRFILIVDGVKEIIHYTLDNYFNNECINDYKSGNFSERIDITIDKGLEKLSVSFCYEYENSITPKYSSAVNILPVKNGGTHINFINEIIRNYFMQKSKKTDYKFQPKDTIVGFRTHISLSLKNPKLKGQSKESLENTEKELSHLLNEFNTKFVITMNDKSDIVNDIMNHFDIHRKKMDLKNIKLSKVTKGRGLKKFTKLRDCQSRNGELFIVEGDSAAGGIIQARNPRNTAVLPLKGKIPSFSNKKNILENKEIGEMINAFGTGIDPHFDIAGFRYDKVICCCDADADGGHIATLLTMNLAMLTPELIKQGHYYIAYTPLYAINEKKVFIPLWTQKDLNKAIEEKRKITRYKGLGELNISDLKTCLLNNDTRKIVQIQWTSKLERLVALMNNVSDKRLLLSGEFE